MPWEYSYPPGSGPHYRLPAVFGSLEMCQCAWAPPWGHGLPSTSYIHYKCPPFPEGQIFPPLDTPSVFWKHAWLSVTVHPSLVSLGGACLMETGIQHSPSPFPFQELWWPFSYCLHSTLSCLVKLGCPLSPSYSCDVKGEFPSLWPEWDHSG